MKRLLLSDIIQPSVEGGAAYFARMADAEDFEGLMDPILGINHFETSGTHKGFYRYGSSPEILYVFDGSAPLHIVNSSGVKTAIAPGSLLWMPEGGRDLHFEETSTGGSRVEGVQLFLNMASNKKEAGWEKLMIRNSNIPILKDEGVQVKVLCGKTGYTSSSIHTPEDLTILEISLEPGKEFRHELPANWSGTLFALEGHFDVMASQETFELKEGMVISMGYCEYSESILLTGLTQSKILFVSGFPLQQDQIDLKVIAREPHFVLSAAQQKSGNNGI